MTFNELRTTHKDLMKMYVYLCKGEKKSICMYTNEITQCTTDHFQQLIKKKLHSPSPLVHPFVLLLRLYEATLLSNDSLSLFLSLLNTGCRI